MMVNRNAINRSVNKHQTNLKRVNTLAKIEANKVLSVLDDMTFGQQATHVRNTIPTIISKYGMVAATVGATHYNEMRNLQKEDYNLAPFVAAVPVGINFKDKIDNMIGFGIAKNDTLGVNAMRSFLVEELTLHVTNYDRETISFNAGKEPKTVKIQRVAEADACAFCATLAAAGVVYEGIAYDEDYVAYANDWHSNCQCSTEVIYENREGQYESLIRPTYYDTLEDNFKAAVAAQEAVRNELIDKHFNEFDKPRFFFKAYPEAAMNTKNITAQMRAITGKN